MNSNIQDRINFRKKILPKQAPLLFSQERNIYEFCQSVNSEINAGYFMFSAAIWTGHYESISVGFFHIFWFTSSSILNLIVSYKNKTEELK